ncbi:putative kinetochore protein NUF2 [Fusarium oxysporum f. sp. albedinis]|nr:putative kinetochore protein NUF2 [Fusarium oxysporum f. sp. albedinis]
MQVAQERWLLGNRAQFKRRHNYNCRYCCSRKRPSESRFEKRRPISGLGAEGQGGEAGESGVTRSGLGRHELAAASPSAGLTARTWSWKDSEATVYGRSRLGTRPVQAPSMDGHCGKAIYPLHLSNRNVSAASALK